VVGLQAPELTEVDPHQAAVTTYQYLRIGMVGVVGLLAVSVAIEWTKAGCFQQSISAYYFTPVRAVFVGGLMAIGAALVFISGRTTPEDVLFNLAGLFAPVVAFIPTTDVGYCWSVAPPAQPVSDGSLAPWVEAGVRNNVTALLVMGVVALVSISLIPVVTGRGSPLGALRSSGAGTKAVLGVFAAVLVVGWWSYTSWAGFFEHAHGYSAVAMFGCLALAVATNAWQLREDRTAWFWAYLSIALCMPAAGVFVWVADRFSQGWDHAVLVLEAIEIALFAAFWALQTVRDWNRTVWDGVPDRSSPTRTGGALV
jgi:hypothetical protein